MAKIYSFEKDGLRKSEPKNIEEMATLSKVTRNDNNIIVLEGKETCRLHWNIPKWLELKLKFDGRTRVLVTLFPGPDFGCHVVRTTCRPSIVEIEVARQRQYISFKIFQMTYIFSLEARIWLQCALWTYLHTSGILKG